jgi:tetratricopeptide (TPR) repeat protein
VDKNKYFIAFIGLALGFIVSFFWTSSYNKSHVGPAAGLASSGAPSSASGAPNQQAMMAQVAQVIEKAKTNPNDFKAQVDAAKLFNKIGRTADTVEYLKKAYEVSAEDFVKQTKTDLQGALPFMAMFYAEQSNYDESDKWIRRALDAEPNDSETRTEIASSYLQRQPPQPDKAIGELQTVLKSNPKDGHALGHLVEAYALKKDIRATEETFNRLKLADPSNDRIPKLETLVADLKAGKPVIIPKE